MATEEKWDVLAVHDDGKGHGFLAGYCVSREVALAQAGIFMKVYPERLFGVAERKKR